MKWMILVLIATGCTTPPTIQDCMAKVERVAGKKNADARQRKREESGAYEMCVRYQCDADDVLANLDY